MSDIWLFIWGRKWWCSNGRRFRRNTSGHLQHHRHRDFWKLSSDDTGHLDCELIRHGRDLRFESARAYHLIPVISMALAVFCDPRCEISVPLSVPLEIGLPLLRNPCRACPGGTLGVWGGDRRPGLNFRSPITGFAPRLRHSSRSLTEIALGPSLARLLDSRTFSRGCPPQDWSILHLVQFSSAATLEYPRNQIVACDCEVQ